MSSLSNVWDWSFFWGVFGNLLKVASPFVMISVAIIGVGMLIGVIVWAVRARGAST